MHTPHAARSHPESRPAAGRCLLDSMCSMDLVPLDQLVGWRIRPEVVWCLQLCVLQSARPDYDKIQINQGGEIWVKFEQTQNQKSYLYTPIYYTTIKWIQYFMGTQCGIENLNRLTQKRCQDRAEYRVMHQGFFFIILTANTQKGQADSFHDFIQNEFIQMSIKGACTSSILPWVIHDILYYFVQDLIKKGSADPDVLDGLSWERLRKSACRGTLSAERLLSTCALGPSES